MKGARWGLFLALLSAAVARADAGGAGAFLEPSNEADLPSDLGQVSLEASRRAVRARITDWDDDGKEIAGARAATCAMAGLGGIWFSPVSPPTLSLLERLPDYLGRRTPGPSTPLEAPLALLARLVTFTPGEQAALQRLQARQVLDRADQIRLAIDTQWFLIQVSARLYDEKFRYHAGRAEGFWGFFRADTELCRAYTYRAERDRALARAGRRVLVFYDFLERELADE
jgi:hypothetical protein